MSVSFRQIFVGGGSVASGASLGAAAAAIVIASVPLIAPMIGAVAGAVLAFASGALTEPEGAPGKPGLPTSQS